MTIYLALGSNLGDREGNLQRAIALLAPEILTLQISPIYETEPMYNTQQPKFLNAALRATRQLSVLEVLKKIKEVEKTMGEHAQNEPRVIDIDILFYDDQVIEGPELTVPHPKIAERAFVLAPLNDIAPTFVHPKEKVTIAELFQRLGSQKDIRRI